MGFVTVGENRGLLRCVRIEFEMMREDTHNGRGFDIAAVVRVLTHRKAGILKK